MRELLDSFCGAIYQENQNKEITSKKIKQKTPKNLYRSISLRYIDVFNKILVNWNWPHIKKITCDDQMGFIPGVKVWFNIQKSININNKFTGYGKNLQSSQNTKKWNTACFHDKKHQQTGMRKGLSQPDTSGWKKSPQLTSYLEMKIKNFCANNRNKIGRSAFISSTQHDTAGSSQCS